ncbi:DUF1223 domain-containing protein [Sneathiella sp.]|uniref:DUF1223 domain-containing protein n=1 Tax=Sneathiella sp. TaxID=1964365 RepID=UPI002FE3BA2A
MHKLRVRQFVFNAAIALFILTGANEAASESAHQPQMVVELFTSQGCSSCPPADKFLGELVRNTDILGLSFSVTYWDYIGWKDVFASEANDARQDAYRDHLRSRYVYTPQMVIGGVKHVVGSDRSSAEALIKKLSGQMTRLPLEWSFDGDQLNIVLPDGSGDATLWLFDLDHEENIDIRRGENKGRVVTYHNIVRKIRSLGQWDGKEKIIRLDLADIRAQGREGCALVVQQRGYGPILAALEVSF